MSRQTERSRAAAASMYTGSMLIAALWPVWAAGFGLTQAIWLSTGLGLALSGGIQLIFASLCPPKIFCDRNLWQATRCSVAKRKLSLLPIIGVIVEDVSYLMALRLIDPTVAQSLLRFYPITYAL